MIRLSKSVFLAFIISLLILPGLVSADAVNSLTASGGGNFNETITIQASVSASSRIQNSNLYFEIRAPDGTVVDTHSISPPPMESGETFSHSWQSSNSAYPTIGNYSVSLCWSPGNSQNCQIASATTSFYSVPTFGTLLTIIALMLVAAWFWYMGGRLQKLKAAESAESPA